MHRQLEITVAPLATDAVLRGLAQIEGVVTLSVRRGESVKPPGDVISAAVLNEQADEALSVVQAAERHGTLSVSTSTLTSLVDIDAQDHVRADTDEALWEEAETALRRHTRPNFNFLITTAAGAVVATAALAATSGVTEATALVAAAIIAPAFEPWARIAVGLVNRHRAVTAHGVITAGLSVVTLVVSAVLTMLVLRLAGHGYGHEFTFSPSVREAEYPPLINLILSAAGAITGVTMISAGRFTQMAGPLVALQLLPAVAVVGGAIGLGDGGIAARGLGRLAVDWGMILLAGGLVFGFKHVRAHGGRRAMR